MPPDAAVRTRPRHGLLAGKTVLVTAAAGTGIGFATAKRCVEEGARVVVSDIHERRLGEAADAARRRAWIAACSATSRTKTTCSALFDAAVEASAAALDVLVNNAGPRRNGHARRDDRRAVVTVLDVTLNGTMRMTRAALRHMQPRSSRARS